MQSTYFVQIQNRLFLRQNFESEFSRAKSLYSNFLHETYHFELWRQIELNFAPILNSSFTATIWMRIFRAKIWNLNILVKIWKSYFRAQFWIHVSRRIFKFDCSRQNYKIEFSHQNLSFYIFFRQNWIRFSRQSFKFEFSRQNLHLKFPSKTQVRIFAPKFEI